MTVKGRFAKHMLRGGRGWQHKATTRISGLEARDSRDADISDASGLANMGVEGLTLSDGAGNTVLTLDPDSNILKLSRIAINGVVLKYIKKITAQTVTNSTTLVDDSDFVIPIVANERLYFRMWLWLEAWPSGGATMDFKCGWSVPTNCVMYWAPLSIDSGATGPNWSRYPVTGVTVPDPRFANETELAGLAAVASVTLLALAGWIFNEGNAGNVIFRWAQNTANANNLTVGGSSFMEVMSLNLFA